MNDSRQSPIIGITTYGRKKDDNYYLPGSYVHSVRSAGGIPILLSPGEKGIVRILELVDGLIFAGGGDIEPSIYGGNSQSTIAGVDPERDEFELALAEEVLKNSIPSLGICRGSQLLNVATGGKLIEDVPDELGDSILHRLNVGEASEHPVQIEQGSRLAEIMGSNEVNVKSQHHQGIHTVPEIWQVSAYSPDGVIEALEHKTHPWMLAVLWHPEISPEDPHHQRLFKAFVEASSITNYSHEHEKR